MPRTKKAPVVSARGLPQPPAAYPMTPTGMRALADAMDDALPTAPRCEFAAFLRGCAGEWEGEVKR